MTVAPVVFAAMLATGVADDAHTAATASYLALGDSYTIGESVEPAGRWPIQLAAALRAEGIVIDDPRIIATTGWTTDELSGAMDAAEPLGEWDFVSLLIGVNNQYRGRSVTDFEGEFSRLLDRAIRLAGDRTGGVIVLAIPDWGVTPFAEGRDRALIAAELDAYNAAQRAICARCGVAFVDIAPISRRLGADPSQLASDGLHPGASIHAQWAKLARSGARERLAATAP